LKQALLNLLTNAIEASPAGGQVETCLQRLGKTAQVTIQDKGSGILEADIERIFSPFFSTKETGSGLGLPFAQKIIELHGGTLRAVNNPDCGATFILGVPLSEDE
jgi:signal transduction histidine kinase